MSGPYFSAIATGSLNSPVFTLERDDRALIIQVPSLTAAASVRCQFTSTSGGTTFHDMYRDDGSATVFFVASGVGPGWGVVPNPPTPFGRITLGAVQSAVTTFTLTLRERN